MGLHEVAVFQDTLEKYHTIYKSQTRSLMRDDTTVFSGNIKYLDRDDPMTVDVVHGGTVNTGRELAKTGKRTAILNFADAITPGGLVLEGETTQEENICRCSNLYASITTPLADKNYYRVNRETMTHGIYTDNLIYSKNVLFFKDDETYEDVEPYYMDVITCPSPSVTIQPYSLAYDVIYHRAEQIIRSAILNGVENLVLGAWGCGAFGQDPKLISRCFKGAICNNRGISNIVFAIRSCKADKFTGTTGNYEIFRKELLC